MYTLFLIAIVAYFFFRKPSLHVGKRLGKWTITGVTGESVELTSKDYVAIVPRSRITRNGYT